MKGGAKGGVEGRDEEGGYDETYISATINSLTFRRQASLYLHIGKDIHRPVSNNQQVPIDVSTELAEPRVSRK